MQSDPSVATGEESYRQLVEAIADYAIYMLDVDGRVTNWNRGAQRFKGYRPEEVVGSHFSRFYTDEDRAAGLPERALAIAARDGKFEAENWHLRKNGERFWAHVIIDPIRDASGRLLGYAKITRDLTERRAAEETLRKSEEQFRLLVQGVSDYAIYMLDIDGRVSSWNTGAERIKGYAPDEIIGHHFSRFYTPEDKERGEPYRALGTARREGRFSAEGWRVRKNGERFRASIVIDAIRDDTGELIGFAKITRDITERENAQRELEKAREALFQSQKMDAIGQLTGGIAHDFNNLLMAIQSSLALLRKRLPEDPQALKLVDNAIQGAERGATLTQRMLAFARRQELKVGRVNIPGLLEEMSDLLQRSIGPEWPISIAFPRALPQVMADANQLEMVLLNLVVNARDASPEGGEIRISGETRMVADKELNELSGGAYVCLKVTDRGSGMDAETLRRAVEPFFTTKGVGKGTGLGLPMVHGFAEQIGGAFVLKSAPGEGTSAEIYLPIAQGTEAAAVPPLEDRAEAALRPLTILAVDDDALVLMNTAALLEDLGHTVLEAESAAQALGIFRDHPEIDLVITDQAMPNMTGAELAAVLRAERPGIPIIVATGYGEDARLGEMRLFRLGKPFSQAHLARALSEALA